MKATQSNTDDLRCYSTKEAASLLGFPPQTLRRWRVRGGGPPYAKIGGRVRYRHADLAAWIEGRVQKNTAMDLKPEDSSGSARIPREVDDDTRDTRDT
ncbi:MAG: helix-turn-helix domain-containing protein [Polyangiaceae bacterium]